MSEIHIIEEEEVEAKSPMESSSPEHDVYETQENPNKSTTQEYLSNVSESFNLEANLKSYIGKHILKDFEGTTYVGEITELLKDEEDSTPFLQVGYEDGDTEEFVEEDLELLDELIEEHELRESPSKFLFDKNLICDICGEKDGYEDMTMQKCSDCGVAVHEGCYGINNHKFLPGRKWKQWKCHACASVGQTVTAIRLSNHHIKYVTITERPVHCAFCNIHSGIHAMHPIYSGPRSKGLPIVSGKSPEEGIQWVHTLCAFALGEHIQTLSLVYGCDDNGNFDGNESNDDESISSSEEQEQRRSHLDFTYRKGDYMLVSTDIHRFVLNNDTPKTMGLFKQFQHLRCLVCNKNSHHSKMIPVQCGYGDCPKAFHVGCAKWGNAYGATFKYFPGEKSFGCCPQHSHLTFSDIQSSKNTTNGDKLSLEEIRKLKNIGNEAINEDFLSCDESSSEDDDEEEHHDQETSEAVSSQVSHSRKKKNRYHPSQQNRKNDSLKSNSEKREIGIKEKTDICKKMVIDLQARLDCCTSIEGIEIEYKRCLKHFRQHEAISKTRFKTCLRTVKDDLKRMKNHAKQHLESSRKVPGNGRKAHRKNNDDSKDKWAHLFIKSGFQMGDPKSRIASGWDRDL